MAADELEELGATMTWRRLELLAPRAGNALPASAMPMSVGVPVLVGSLMLRRAFRRRA
jgi:hypothetical protein